MSEIKIFDTEQDARTDFNLNFTELDRECKDLVRGSKVTPNDNYHGFYTHVIILPGRGTVEGRLVSWCIDLGYTHEIKEIV